MTSATIPFRGQIATSYMKVGKKDGTTKFYRIKDGTTVEIDEQTYINEGGQ